MTVFFLGYFVMGLIFLVLRFFYHVSKKISPKNLFHAMKKDFLNLFAYARQIILSNPIKIKIVVGFIIIFIFAAIFPIKNLIIFDYFLFAIIFLLMVIIFASRDDPENKKFSRLLEIFFARKNIFCST